MKVTMEQVQAAIIKHASGPPTQRLGQFLMNELMPDESCSEVFFEQNNIQAMSKFVNRFVEKDA